MLVSSLQRSGDLLLELVKKSDTTTEDKSMAMREIRSLSDSPMNVSLLKASGIGKTVKKFLKACCGRETLLGLDQAIDLSGINSQETLKSKLESALQAWMALAANSGVKMKASIDSKPCNNVNSDQELASAERCLSWRQLFATLTEYDDSRRSNQGARMRERRKKLDSVRPKIVKVRPSNPRRDALFSRGGIVGSGGISSNGNSKIQQLKIEANVTATRRRPPSQSKTPTGGFAAAVAFASGSKSGTKRKAATTLVPLGGGKSMKVPDTKRAPPNLQKRLNMTKKNGPAPRR